MNSTTQYLTWSDAWSRIREPGWESPWLNCSGDGNPAFSAWSPKENRGIRVVEHETPGFTHWFDKFGDDITELVIACDGSRASLQRAGAMMKQWMAGEHPGDSPIAYGVPRGWLSANDMLQIENKLKGT